MRVRKSLVMGFALILVMSTSLAWASSAAPGMSPDTALTLLKEGNDRYVAGTPQHPNQDKDRRSLTATGGQQPYATILGCSDSRVPPEILFDTGIGDIFIIRVAGNVADTDEIGSIEYGVDHLGTPVLLVLGHTHCGAVTAVVQKAELHGKIPSLVDNIRPAAKEAKKKNPDLGGDALVEETVKVNVWQSIEDLLRGSRAIRNRARGGAVMIVGALYDIDSGVVAWMGTHPEQDKILAKYAKNDSKSKKPHGGKKKK
jgi:carbonic anhydrase